MGIIEGQVAFVTGGASGIGRGVVERFADEGARIGFTDQDEEGGNQLLQAIKDKGGQAIFVPGDISSAADVERAVQQTVQVFGKLDFVFANAGINGVWAPLEELTPEEWDKTHAINLRGTFLTLHYAIPHLKANGGGSIAITASVNGTRTFSNPGATAYSASKAGQIAVMKHAALELGRHNIRVNAVCPGAIHTNIDSRTEKRDVEELKIEVKLPQGSPAVHGGQGDSVDVADVCLFLASNLSRHVSGVELFVDGGASLLR